MNSGPVSKDLCRMGTRAPGTVRNSDSDFMTLKTTHARKSILMVELKTLRKVHHMANAQNHAFVT